MTILRNLLHLLLPAFLLGLSNSLTGQVRLEGILLNALDSTAIPFATIQISDGLKGALTNQEGRFSFVFHHRKNTLELEIRAIGLREKVLFRPRYAGVETLYVVQQPSEIAEVKIEGMTARKVLRRAVAAIPDNYPAASFAAPSFFRYYTQINGTFKNLIETRSVVMFQLEQSGKTLSSREAFALTNLRRSKLEFVIDEFYGPQYPDLLRQNPVYHPDFNSLYPALISSMEVHFDTITAGQFVIRFVNTIAPSENHGIDNYPEAGFLGESRETGLVTIDRKSLAIVRYERVATRNAGYHYPRKNNFIVPDRRHTVEFVEGHLVCEYQLFEGKWYPKSIRHRFTNQYYPTWKGIGQYLITEYSEWYARDYTRYIDEAVVDQFYYVPDLSHLAWPYRPEDWQDVPNLFWVPKDSLYRGLSEGDGLDRQFEIEAQTNRQ